MLFISVTNIISVIFKAKDEVSAEEQEMMEELQETTDLDLKKFGIGTTAVKDMIWLLFLIYCAASLSAFWLKVVLAAVMAFYSYAIYSNIRNRNSAEKQFSLNKWLHIPIDIATIYIIISVALIKFQVI
jgi:heme/copper-type cytochrome/quinol oxidase subunit 2